MLQSSDYGLWEGHKREHRQAWPLVPPMAFSRAQQEASGVGPCSGTGLRSLALPPYIRAPSYIRLGIDLMGHVG